MNKVLIVEREPILLEILEKRLQMEGWLTKGCGNGKEARELIDEFLPDMLITNVLLSFYTGQEVMNYAKEKIKDVYIIVIGIFHQDDAKELLLKNGADAYFSKPFDLEEVTNFIQIQKNRVIE